MATTVSYMGYVARVEYDPRDEIFVGRVDLPDALVSFHGETFEALMLEFRNAITDYERTN
ncbi:hypothetical protein FCJ61_25340 [Burkholderia metallica]|uniref:hypothetical protein n=1 Tax=Burkholderia metallica TaxID=488729 RepID=UPI00157A4D17|nr:hypothetical protein [Burkholderia metallica]NTZ86237.1 hypothetical protein [Burkholderia metallica]